MAALIGAGLSQAESLAADRRPFARVTVGRHVDDLEIAGQPGRAGEDEADHGTGEEDDADRLGGLDLRDQCRTQGLAQVGPGRFRRRLAERKGFVAVRMGPRVMRTETAPIAALAAIQTLWGDFR